MTLSCKNIYHSLFSLGCIEVVVVDEEVGGALQCRTARPLSLLASALGGGRRRARATALCALRRRGFLGLLRRLVVTVVVLFDRPARLILTTTPTVATSRSPPVYRAVRHDDVGILFVRERVQADLLNTKGQSPCAMSFD